MDTPTHSSGTNPIVPTHEAPESSQEPAKKKRKRSKKKKADPGGPPGAQDETAAGTNPSVGGEGADGEASSSKPAKAGKKKVGYGARKSAGASHSFRQAFISTHSRADARKFASERRRLKRQDERSADTICFACREKGHAARNCPKAISDDATGGRKLGKQAVGICYR